MIGEVSSKRDSFDRISGLVIVLMASAVGLYFINLSLLLVATFGVGQITVRAKSSRKVTFQSDQVEYGSLSQYYDTAFIVDPIPFSISRKLVCPVIVFHGDDRNLKTEQLAAFNITKRGGKPARKHAQTLAARMSVQYRELEGK